MIKTIRERWRDRSWPHIGWFVHGQALMDIDALLAEIEKLERDAARYRWIRDAECTTETSECLPTWQGQDLDRRVDELMRHGL